MRLGQQGSGKYLLSNAFALLRCKAEFVSDGKLPTPRTPVGLHDSVQEVISRFQQQVADHMCQNMTQNFAPREI